MNNISEKIKSGAVLSNAWMTSGSAWSAELVSKVGFDVMTIDAQHGLATDLSAILPMLQAMQSGKSVPFVRIPSTDAAFAMRMLDAGALGLICPLIKTPAEVKEFVSASYYPPLGERSLGPFRASLYQENYFTSANENITTLAMIETKESFDNLSEIACIEGLTGLYVGPWDLSISLGFKNVADFEDPKQLSIFEKIINEAEKNGKWAGIQCPNPEIGLKMSKLGFKFITIYEDTVGIKLSAKADLKTFKLD